ncbi:hypothetical protein ACFLQ9_01750 [Bacteroidota bacterium]
MYNSASAQQIKSFSTDTLVYLEQLSELMARKELKRELADFMEQYTDFIYNRTIVHDQFQRIINTSNKFLKKRAKNYPHFENYLRCLLLFAEYHKDTLDYNHWENAINRMADTRRITISKINQILEITSELIYDNTIYKSPTTHWKANKESYKIRFDDKQLRIEFEDIDLSCYAKNDSIKIFHTSGTFYPELIEWNGNNGIVNWERVGFPQDTIKAELADYKINMKKSEYNADSVIFTHKTYFEEPLLGILNDKVMNILIPSSAVFPRFDSYSKRFIIENIYKDVNYNGGFSMRGAKFIGSGSETKPAYLEILRDIEIIEGTDTIVENVLFLVGASKYYVFTKDGVASKNTAVTMKLDNDSIYHPGLFFRYNVNDRMVSLVRNQDDENLSKSPYYNTYHKIDMDFELLSWNLEDDFVNIGMLKGSAVNKAYFESENFFSSEKYTRVQGIDAIHPYQGLRRFAKRIDSEEFTAEEYAIYMRKPITQVRQQLTLLSYSGVIDYNILTEEVRIKERLKHYVEAMYGNRDYDVIDFSSETSGNKKNAILNLTNFDLLIYGVPRIFLSDSQNVVLYPENSRIVLKKNRDFDFSGEIEAGLFTFYGRNFSFNYNKFRINLNRIDSLRLKIVDEETDNWGREMLVNIKSVIENITGELLIDDPDNKSGKEPFPEYPIFDSKQNSFVYFDKPYIQGGAYPRSQVYFIIDPYRLDSLDNFSTIGLGFDGVFESGEIIPTIREKLVVQDDNSLGFIHRTPPEGFPLYGGKGVFKNDIQISNEGLNGDGSFEYIHSVTYSDNFVFLPDSMRAIAQQFINEKYTQTPQFPVAYGLDVKVRWLPEEDEYYINTRSEAITMYDTKAAMNGTLKLEPQGITGWGRMDIGEGLINSDLFKYEANEFLADTADYKLKTHDLASDAFRAKNLKTLVNFNKDVVQFKANDGITKIEMPKNKYISYMEKFTWYLDRKEIEMSTDIYLSVIEKGVSRMVEKDQTENKPLGSLFMSVHPKQDSLNFISPKAIFNTSDYVINAYDVKYIKVADAMIYLSDGDVKIDKDAKMQTLKNTELIANDSSKYHRFYNADINIFGRLSYSGSGDYDYFDKLGKKQKIEFDLIAVNDSIETYAKGKIPSLGNFMLSPIYEYYGDVMLEAKKQFMTFSGYTKIQYDCAGIGRNWFSFTSEINPNEIFIPITASTTDNENDELLSGVLMAKDSVYLIPRFLNKQKHSSDIPVFLSEGGFLNYDMKDKKYIITSMEKHLVNDLPGNYISLNRLYCNLFGEGNLNLGVNLGQIETEMVGNIIDDLNKKSVIIDALLALDFFFAEQAIEVMADTINSNSVLKAVNIARPTYKKGLQELIGIELAGELFDEAKLFGVYRKVPEELIHTILFTDVHLKWNQEASAWQSFGKIGIGNIKETQVNKLVEGHIEIQKKRAGDVLSIYLEIDRNNWFFFNYKRGLMQAYSSNAAFNDILRNIKASKRKLEVPRGQDQYMFFLSNVTRKNQFVRQFEEE